MADERRWVFCATLVVFALTLVNAEGRTSGSVDALKQHSIKCGYPPPETYVTERLFTKCAEDTPIVQDMCELYEKEVGRLCDTSGPSEVTETADETKQMINATLHHCEVAKRVKFSPQVKKYLQGQSCASSCSVSGAPEVCQLLIILYLTGPTSFLDASTRAAPSTTLPAASTPDPTTTLANPTANLGNTTAALPNATTAPTKTTTGPTKTTTTLPNTASPSDPKDDPKADKTDKSWIKTLLYPAIVLIACAFLFLVYTKRRQILTCLQDDPESSKSPEDGKGRYRKLPNFQKAVPSLQEVDKVKSFVY